MSDLCCIHLWEDLACLTQTHPVMLTLHSPFILCWRLETSTALTGTQSVDLKTHASKPDLELHTPNFNIKMPHNHSIHVEIVLVLYSFSMSATCVEGRSYLPWLGTKVNDIVFPSKPNPLLRIWVSNIIYTVRTRYRGCNGCGGCTPFFPHTSTWIRPYDIFVHFVNWVFYKVLDLPLGPKN